MITKICSKCKLEKELSEFEKRPDSRDGRRAYCNSCKLIQAKIAYKVRLESDIMTFWKTRAESLNGSGGRRNGRAGDIIKASPKIIPEDIKILYENNPNCKYCDIPLTKEFMVFDHKTPLSRNGEHNINNLCIACKDCNQLKYSRTEEEFLLFLEEYLNRFIGNTVQNNLITKGRLSV